jgi:hypothetical protein
MTFIILTNGFFKAFISDAARRVYTCNLSDGSYTQSPDENNVSRQNA